MAESQNSSQNNAPKDKIWYDPEEYAIRKRLPPSLPRRPNDIYISNKTAFKAQIGNNDTIYQVSAKKFCLKDNRLFATY